MKINLCIDASYLLYKNVFILKKLNSLKDLKEVMLNDLNKIIRTFPFDNIYFSVDSKSSYWRKDIYPEYKGKRVKDETIDWEFVYKEYAEFLEDVQNRINIKYLFLKGLEGDDFIAHVVRESNKKGYSCLILASDGDLQQLLTYDLNQDFLNIQWNYKFSDERVYLPENYQLILDKLSNKITENVSFENIFESDDSKDFANTLQDLINRTKTKTIISEELSIRKLITGDKGDNIPGCVKCKDGKINPDGRGIGEDGSKTVYDLYKEIHPNPINIDTDELINNLADVIIYYKKIKDPIAKETIRKNLIFNRMMMILDPKYMPVDVYDKMKKYFEEIDNRVIEYTEIDLEKQLESDNFFKQKTEDIPEQFRMDEVIGTFNPDDFWNL